MEDDFNRADNTDLGGKWVEYSGDWEILSNQLRANSTGTPHEMIYTAATIEKNRRYVKVVAKNVQEGKTYRLAPAIDSNLTDYVFVNLYIGETLATVSVGKVDGGVTTTWDSYDFVYTPGADYTLIACLTTNGIMAGLSEISYPVWDCKVLTDSTNPSGVCRRAGLVNMASTVEYEDFGFYKHALDDPTNSVYCPECQCECEGHCIPKTLTLTLESNCEDRDGLTATLEIDISVYPNLEWYGEATWIDPLGVTSTLHKFRLYCIDAVPASCQDGTKFFLCADGFHTYCSTSDWDNDTSFLCGVGIPGACSASYTCPLNVRFGPGTCGYSPPPEPPPECIETIVITA